MEIDANFVAIASIIGEPARASMLWHLLDGRAYTAGELANVADISSTSGSNHLNKLLEAKLLKVEVQGRHRYYSFSRPEVAYAIESLANLTLDNKRIAASPTRTGVKYCRTCYDHLAGTVGVKITQALVEKKVLKVSSKDYLLTETGWKWLEALGITNDTLTGSKRLFSRQCLDWSERKPHLAGHLGAVLLKKMKELDWFRKVNFTREMIVTPKGQMRIYDLLNIKI
jgi:DNA-binding transcriptional ArsR family regulator